MNRKKFLIPTLIILVLLAASPVAAQVGDTTEATLQVGSGQLTVGDSIMLELTVNHPADSHVIIPDIPSEWGNFIVHSQSAPETNVNDDGSKTTIQMIDARLFAPGEYSTPSLPVTIADGNGNLTELLVEPMAITITSILVEGDQELRDIKPQAELPYLFLLPWIIAALVVASIVVVAVLLLRRRKARLALADMDPRMPHEVALDRLGRIERLDLPGQDRFKEHYTLISDCLRIYVEREFDVPVMERTTAEIQNSIKKTIITRPIARQFLTLLDESDLVKFSKFTPDIVSANQALQLGRLIVEETMPIREPDSPDSEFGGLLSPQADQTSDPALSVNGKYRRTEMRA
jgi:hypothetical protein